MKNARPLTAAELVDVSSKCEHPGVAGVLSDIGDDGLDDYDGKFLVVDGDCIVEGDLDTDTDEITVLVVRGDLTVNGTFRDRSDDGPTITVVFGDLRARNVITAGLLEVHGDMVVEQAVVGDYNEGGAFIHGGLTAELLMPVGIEYEVRGAITCSEQIPGFTTRIDFIPKRLHPRFFVARDEGRAELFAGEAGDGFVEALARGESILS